ncbi:MAG: serine hydrolase domain-containing protein [Crocinitomicaceae bacterium]
MKRFNVSITTMAIAFFIFNGCKKDEVEINGIEDFETYLSEEMTDQNIPATAVMIFKGETILYEKYQGYSNIQQNVALADNHLFLIASISKVVTATALLQLYEDGAFGLDEPINNYLPFSVTVPGYSQQITFRMLLTHTSGIADNDVVMDAQYYYNQDPPISLASFIENYLEVGGTFYDEYDNFHDFEPGTQFEYSNIGSAVIGVLVENISGLDFNTYCKDNIFTPLGMTNTSWRLNEITQTIVTPYDFLNGSNQVIQHYTNTDYPNGGLRTTVQDLHKLLIAFENAGMSNGHPLLESSTIDAMMSAQFINSQGETVGLHLYLDEETNTWGHDGGEQGVATIMGFNPTSKVGAIVFTNQGEADLDGLFEEAYKLGEKL